MLTYYRVYCQNGNADIHAGSKTEARVAARELRLGPILRIRQRLLFASRMPQEFSVSLLRRIASHAEAGNSVSRSFVIECDAETTPKYRAMLQPAADAVARGVSLADALTQSGLFDDTTRRMLDVAERGINTPDVLSTLIERQESSLSAWRMIRHYGWYYGVQYLMALTMAIGLRAELLPVMRTQAAGHTKQLEMLAFVDASVLLYLLVIYGFALAGIGLWAALTLGSQSTRIYADYLLRIVPGVTGMVHSPALADSMLTASWALKAGIHQPVAFALAADTSSIHSIRSLWNTALERVNQGQLLAVAFAGGLLTSREQGELAAYQDKDSSKVANLFRKFAKDRLLTAELETKRASLFYTLAFSGGLLVLAGLALYAGFAADQSIGETIKQLTEF